MKLKLSDAGIIVSKSVGSIKVVEGDEEGVIDFIASSNAEDRDEDIVRQDGLILDYYRQNPVFLWAHAPHIPPIGRSTESKLNELGKFQIKVKFDLDDEFASKVYKKYRKGFMKMVSIGFLPIELEERENSRGFVFLESEIMEVSAVPVGSNREALAIERSTDGKNIKSTPFRKWLDDNPDCIITSTRGAELTITKDAGDGAEDAGEVDEVDAEGADNGANGAKNGTNGADAAENGADEADEAADHDKNAPEEAESAPEGDKEADTDADDGADADDKGEELPDLGLEAFNEVIERFNSGEFEGFTVASDKVISSLMDKLPEEAAEQVVLTRCYTEEEDGDAVIREPQGATILSLKDEATDDEGEKGGDPASTDETGGVADLPDEQGADERQPDVGDAGKTVVININNEGLEPKDAKEVAKHLHDLLGSSTHEAKGSSEEDEPEPEEAPDANEPKTAKLTVVSGISE